MESNCPRNRYTKVMGRVSLNLSKERLIDIAAETRFRADILEKVLHLLHLLEALNEHPILKSKWALKGGTALNLFFLKVPRLSVDIDLNYTGAVEREDMTRERPKIEQALQNVCQREGFSITRSPSDHAGGKWRLKYRGGSHLKKISYASPRGQQSNP